MNIEKITLSSMVAITLLSFSGCGSSDEISNTGIKLTAQSIANRSVADYTKNSYGLVDANKVSKWVTDWKNNKPAGITGKLIILQIGEIKVGDNNYNYLKGNDNDVLVYEMGDLCNTYYPRNDGVSTIAKAVNEGENIDGMMMQMNVDPKNDMLLFVQGNGLNKGKNIAGAARMWYTFTYWGLKKENMSLLNGNASYVLNPIANTTLNINKSDIYGKNPTTPTMTGKVKIASVRQNGTILQATMKDMMNLIDKNNGNSLIIDARSSNEFNGISRAKTELKNCGINQDEQCYTAFDGHIKNSKNLYYTDILDLTDTADLDGDGEITDIKESSYVFKSQADIEKLFTDIGYTDKKTIYTYCRTGTKASLVTFASSQVLGYSTRMYDGSWIQWGKMAYREDSNNQTLISENSIWRMDIEKYSESITYNGDKLTVHSTNKNTLNLSAIDSDAIIKADINYKALEK